MKEYFTGEDGKETEFEPEERAALREVRSELRDTWPYIRGIVDIAKGAKALGAVVVAMMSLGILGAFLLELGVF